MLTNKALRLALGLASGKSLMEAVSPAMMANIYIPISREQGEFAYLLARTIGASRIVEFGTSFGISTIYLAAAIRDNGGENGFESRTLSIADGFEFSEYTG